MEPGSRNPEYEPGYLLGPRTADILRLNDGETIQVTDWWKPGGSETYIATFSILQQDGVRHDLIAKSCIKMCPKETMHEWLDRRSILTENGVLFPELYAVDGATLVEEYIPYSFKDAYNVADVSVKKELHYKYIDMYKKICGSGFKPASMHDVRSRGNDVVMIDVGEDLGGRLHIDQTNMSVIIKAERNFRESTGS